VKIFALALMFTVLAVSTAQYDTTPTELSLEQNWNPEMTPAQPVRMPWVEDNEPYPASTGISPVAEETSARVGRVR
jgi:hypothetical protein